MRKISELLSSFAAAPDPISGLEQAQIELTASRGAVEAELASMPAAREAALENDDAALLATLRQRRPVLEDESARLALAVQKIGEKIKDERAAAKARRADEFRAQHVEAVSAYLQTAHPAMASFDAILTVRATAIREGFANVVATLELPPNLNGHGVLVRNRLELFEANLKGAPAAPRRVKATATERKIVAPPRMTDSQGMVRLGEMQTERRERRALLNEVPGAGEIAISILRSGIELPNRPSLIAGDRIALMPDTARPLLERGVADLVEAGQPKAMNTETAGEESRV